MLDRTMRLSENYGRRQSLISVIFVANRTLRFADRIVVRPERREDRELCAELIRVEWEEELGLPASEWAILDDISPSGACLEMEEAIPPGTLISIQFTGDNCKARTIYCNPERSNFLIGVQFEQGYRWSRRKFKPEHLLQFRLCKVQK
jgi:hypothetical protein